MITPEEEAALIAFIDEQPLSPFQFQEWLGKRLTASFGWLHDFDNVMLDPTEPIPEPLLLLKRRAADFGGLHDAELVQVLLIRYNRGAGIGWRRDLPVFEHVVGISLGQPGTMRFRQRMEQGSGAFRLRYRPARSTI